MTWPFIVCHITASLCCSSCIELHYNSLYCTALHWKAMHGNAMHCTVPLVSCFFRYWPWKPLHDQFLLSRTIDKWKPSMYHTNLYWKTLHYPFNPQCTAIVEISWEMAKCKTDKAVPNLLKQYLCCIEHSQLLKRIILKFNSSSIALLTMCIS